MKKDKTIENIFTKVLKTAKKKLGNSIDNKDIENCLDIMLNGVAVNIERGNNIQFPYFGKWQVLEDRKEFVSKEVTPVFKSKPRYGRKENTNNLIRNRINK